MSNTKTGYKQTEVGLIPGDWKVFKLGQCLLKNPDYGINAAAVEYDDTLPTYLRITDISEDGKFISSNKASVNNSLSNSYYLEKGDIVFARTGASVGKTYLYNENDGRLVFAGFLIRIKANPEVVDYRYLIYLTQTKTYWAWVSANSMRSGQPGLNSNEYKSFQIPLPPTIAEQTAIANALIDADALISGLEKLIAKKRNIKQGAMQKLLQPKEGWEVKKLGEICEFTQGIQIPMSDLNKQSNEGLIRYLYIRDFFTDDFQWYVANIYPSKIMERTDIMMINTGNTAGKVYSGAYGVLSNNAFKISFNQNVVDRNYLFELLKSKFVQSSIQELFNSSGQPHVGHKNIAKVIIPFPPKDEQTHIATILSDMESEISALETKLEKYKKVKLGMMQNLLTGKIRLV